MISTFSKLQNASPDTSAHLLATRAFYISNDLYGNYLMCSFEMEKGMTKQLIAGKHFSVRDEIIKAQE